MEVNYTDCGERFATYTNIESVCSSPETNMCYVSYILIKTSMHKIKHFVFPIFIPIYIVNQKLSRSVTLKCVYEFSGCF